LEDFRMVTVDDRNVRLIESHRKICPPFVLDETLCLYSPQDNVDALKHPRVAAWLDFVTQEYRPEIPAAERRMLLLMPCTKTKPYPFSTEHKRINQRLLAAGFRPSYNIPLPAEIRARLEPDYDQEVLNLAPLVNNRGIIIHRAVISEPLAFVPYEHIVAYPHGPSPASGYDDPGLFENRGNAVSPWRADCTAVRVSNTRWKWGPQELRSYVVMHNAMAEWAAKAIMRIASHYTEIVAWVAPGLTHRSFLIGRNERRIHNIPAFRKIGRDHHELVGVNDLLAEGVKVICLPTVAQCRTAVERLAGRLGTDVSRVGGVYSRGGGDATPLALPELLDVLMAHVGAVNASGLAA
jgi:hypothetical protein